MLDHKSGPSIFKKIKIISNFFSDYNTLRNTIRLENDYKKKLQNKQMEGKQYATEQPMGYWRNKKYLETNENNPRPVEHSKI